MGSSFMIFLLLQQSTSYFFKECKLSDMTYLIQMTYNQIYIFTMNFPKARPLNNRSLVGIVHKFHTSYGTKFQNFSEQISQKFDRFIPIEVDPRVNQKYQNYYFPCFIFMTLLLKKIQRTWEEQSFDRKQFLNDIKNKEKDIWDKISTFKDIRSDMPRRFYDAVAYSLNDPSTFFEIIQTHKKYTYALVNTICGKKFDKDFDKISNYTNEEIHIFSTYFKENLYVINYDESKEPFSHIKQVDSRNVYLVKAKEIFFLVFRLQDIKVNSGKGMVDHFELAEIFGIEHKLEASSPVKQQQSKIEGTNELIPSTKAASNKLGQSSSPQKQGEYRPEINLITKNMSQGQPQNYPQPPSLKTVTKIRTSNLFPQQVKCKNCCKQISEFNALYWNYSHYCLECVVNPKVDISFVPTSLIKKYLKSVGYDTNSPYYVICPQCKSEGTIPHYKVEDKARSYQCKTCQKTICVEHQQLILECFCFCLECKRQTFTIEGMLQKYCADCKKRFCQLCSTKGKEWCGCICRICGNVDLADHECGGMCHGCGGNRLNLRDCGCGKKLCSACFFRSMEPGESMCQVK